MTSLLLRSLGYAIITKLYNIKRKTQAIPFWLLVYIEKIFDEQGKNIYFTKKNLTKLGKYCYRISSKISFLLSPKSPPKKIAGFAAVNIVRLRCLIAK